jgi:LuxR family transcriptional activator of conjugal transfer of Ti plasmids
VALTLVRLIASFESSGSIGVIYEEASHDRELSLWTGRQLQWAQLASKSPYTANSRQVRGLAWLLGSASQGFTAADRSRGQMRKIERACSEFLDGLHSSMTKEEFQRVAERASRDLGFRWYAYVCGGEGEPNVITSYPKNWVERYLEKNYLDVDPVLRRGRRPEQAFVWDCRDSRAARSGRERRFFADALSVGIETGLTIPVRAGFGRFAMLSFAADHPAPQLEQIVQDARDILQTMSVACHAHAHARIANVRTQCTTNTPLTQRERQCLTWASCGKTREETAMILGVSPRAVRFHLDNARQNLGASTITHAVALAIRQGLLPQ